VVSREVPALPDARHDFGSSDYPDPSVLIQLTILWIAIPLFVQTVAIFALGYALAKFLGLSYENAAPTAMIGASNHFEVAIATAAMLYGLSSGAALATVVGVLIEVLSK
jgi:ACR3 family arsenite transporter